MEILGESLARLRATRTSVKWRVYGDDVLPLWVAEMDARPCAPVVEAVTAALGRGDTGYATRPDTLAAALHGFAGRRWGWDADLSAAVGVADVMVGITELIRAATPEHSPVVVSPPCYDAFHGMITSIRRPAVLAPLTADHRLDPDALDRAFAEAGPGAAYVLCNPQNPTGTLHRADELTMLAELADRHGILVISDEIHAPLVQPGHEFVPYLSLPQAQRGVAVHSASKAFNLAGLRAALVVPGAEARAATQQIHEFVTHATQLIGVVAQTAAWTHGDPWLDQVLGEIADRRRLVTRLLAERLPEVRVTPADATYLAWLDCSRLGLADPHRAFLRHGVALSAGQSYDRAATQWVRFNLATSPEVVTAAVDRMAAAAG